MAADFAQSHEWFDVHAVGCVTSESGNILLETADVDSTVTDYAFASLEGTLQGKERWWRPRGGAIQ